MTTKENALKLLAIFIFLTFVAFMAVCKSASPQLVGKPDTPEARARQSSDEPILPIPTDITLDAKKVALGEKLFNEPRLSSDDTISCASCHNLDLGGTDQKVHSVGIKGRVGGINSPTVFNSGYNFKQFWDGRAETLELQVDGPTHAPGEMGSDWDEITAKLQATPTYVADFRESYRDGISVDNIKDAIATFERSLTTPNSKFDQYLGGDQEALTKEEKDGYRTFKSVGCISCHQGINVGGNLFQELGVMGDYFKDRGNMTTADYGRYNVTHADNDKYVFKVPSLRNVSRTHPYFHDGSVNTLEGAVTVMSKYQLGRQLSPQEIESIVRFLRTLDGEYTRYNR